MYDNLQPADHSIPVITPDETKISIRDKIMDKIAEVVDVIEERIEDIIGGDQKEPSVVIPEEEHLFGEDGH